jgi:hypothetical protein
MSSATAMVAMMIRRFPAYPETHRPIVSGQIIAKLLERRPISVTGPYHARM